MTEHRADAYAPQVQAVQIGVAAGGKVVHRFGHPVDVDRVVYIVLGDRALPESILHAVDRDGAGVHHPLNAAPAGGLEYVIRAADVDLHGEMGAVFGVGRQQGRHVDDAPHAVGVDRFQEVGQLRDIAPVHLHAVQVRRQVGPRRRQVETDHFLAALHQLANNPVADKPGSPGDHHGHLPFSPGFPPVIVCASAEFAMPMPSL